MAGTVTDVLAIAVEVMDREWEWGSADCCTAACDVFRRLHGIDPMASLRGRYDSALSAARIVTINGGFPALAGRLALRARLRPGSGAPGEIGLTHEGAAQGFGGRALAISLGGGVYAGKTHQGLFIFEGAQRTWGV